MPAQAPTAPTAGQIRAQMEQQLGTVPAAIDKSLNADPTMIFEHVRAQQYAMPPEGRALDPQERTLVYLAVALATSNHACTQAMAQKARSESIASPKLLEAFHIARLAQATAVLGNAEPVFDLVNERSDRAAQR